MKIDELLSLFQNNLSTIEESHIDQKGYLWITIDRSELVKAAQFIKDQFKDTNIIFTHCFATDFLESEGKMEMIYGWWQIDHNLYFNLRLFLPADDLKVDSIISIWHNANWHEREAWELLGVDVVGHPNLVPLLLPDELVGKHPMRKAFKIREETGD